jgi:hypothetical protein
MAVVLCAFVCCCKIIWEQSGNTRGSVLVFLGAPARLEDREM